jgi:hypothetical protein
MAAIDFPDNPEVNDEFTVNDRTWIYMGEGIWNTSETQVIEGPEGPVGPSGIAVQEEAPENLGVIWLDTDEEPIVLVPVGGETGQVLTKASDDDYDTEWSDSYSNTEIDTLLSEKSDTGHIHDDRYYTETETDTFLNSKANLSGGNSFTGTQSLTPSNLSTTPLIVNGASGQSASLQEWTNSSGTNLVSIDANGVLNMNASTSGIDMKNKNILNVNLITINDPGVNEGIEWLGGSNWKIYESPDNLTNSAGNLQFVTGSTRRMTLDTSSRLSITGQPAMFLDGNDFNWRAEPAGTIKKMSVRESRGGLSWNATNGRVTVPIAGWYSVSNVIYQAPNTTMRRTIRVNESAKAMLHTFRTGEGQSVIQGIFFCAANDFIDFFLESASINVFYGGNHVYSTINFLG